MPSLEAQSSCPPAASVACCAPLGSPTCGAGAPAQRAQQGRHRGWRAARQRLGGGQAGGQLVQQAQQGAADLVCRWGGVGWGAFSSNMCPTCTEKATPGSREAVARCSHCHQAPPPRAWATLQVSARTWQQRLSIQQLGGEAARRQRRRPRRQQTHQFLDIPQRHSMLRQARLRLQRRHCRRRQQQRQVGSGGAVQARVSACAGRCSRARRRSGGARCVHQGRPRRGLAGAADGAAAGGL